MSRVFLLLFLVAPIHWLGCARSDQGPGPASPMQTESARLAPDPELVPPTQEGDDGWLLYLGAPTWTPQRVAGRHFGDASPEEAVLHYFACRMQGAECFREVLVSPASERLTRKLAIHDQWRFLELRLVARQDAGDGELWLKVYLRVSIDGQEDGGEDEVTLLEQDGRWVILSVPT